MRAVIQRVSEASVVIGEQKVADINQGLLVFLGVETEDVKEDAFVIEVHGGTKLKIVKTAVSMTGDASIEQK